MQLLQKRLRALNEPVSEGEEEGEGTDEENTKVENEVD